MSEISLLKSMLWELFLNNIFNNKISHSRKLFGLDREKVAEKLSQNSTSNIYYDLFACSKSLEVAKHGNLNFLKSQELLRKVKSEHE